jgi:hypothetical protein
MPPMRMKAFLVVNQNVTHDTQHGGDGLLGLGKPDELAPDANVPAHRHGRVLDVPFEANVHTVPVSWKVHRNEPTLQFGRFRVIKGDPETEHGDVDDSKSFPPASRSPASWYEAAQPAAWRCRRRRFSTACLSVPTPSGASRGHFQTAVPKTCPLQWDYGSNARLGSSIVRPLSDRNGGSQTDACTSTRGQVSTRRRGRRITSSTVPARMTSRRRRASTGAPSAGERSDQAQRDGTITSRNRKESAATSPGHVPPRLVTDVERLYVTRWTEASGSFGRSDRASDEWNISSRRARSVKDFDDVGAGPEVRKPLYFLCATRLGGTQ